MRAFSNVFDSHFFSSLFRDAVYRSFEKNGIAIKTRGYLASLYASSPPSIPFIMPKDST